MCKLLRIQCEQRWEVAQPCKAVRKRWLDEGPSAGGPGAHPSFGPPISSTWPHMPAAGLSQLEQEHSNGTSHQPQSQAVGLGIPTPV